MERGKGYWTEAPPHKGEKEIPKGTSDCLSGFTFVITGTLDSLERDEAETLIKLHGGRVTSKVSKKTSYLLVDDDIGGTKSVKAKELGTKLISEDGLFDLIRGSVPPSESVVSSMEKKPIPTVVGSLTKNEEVQTNVPTNLGLLAWTEKYKPKNVDEIVGNQPLVKQLREWLENWEVKHLRRSSYVKLGKRREPSSSSESGLKKAVLLSGSPGVGKTSSARLVSQALGFNVIEVNASDSRGKADSKIVKGICGSRANSIKELISNGSLSYGRKTVLIMDEVDGMSAGDRGGVSELVASIKLSKIPIICICNDRYSQKLKTLVNYCLLLNYRKPTKQLITSRLMHIANAEGIDVNRIPLAEICESVNGDIRMAINQLQFMSRSMSAITASNITSKDEVISPFNAVDTLMGTNGGKLGIDERMELSTSDLDLVPLLIQENYLNFQPGQDKNEVKRMKLISHAAESIANGDAINVYIRRHQQWQLLQSGSLSSCIIPAFLLHGKRQVLEQGERNFTRFSTWLGKNSTLGKNSRLLENLHHHLLSSREVITSKESLRADYFSLILNHLADPLRLFPKEKAVKQVVHFMDMYCINQEDMSTVVELSKFPRQPNPLHGVQPAVKAALTKAYKQGSGQRVVRTADLIKVPGEKRGLKRVPETREDAESEKDASDAEDDGMENGGKKLKLSL